LRQFVSLAARGIVTNYHGKDDVVMARHFEPVREFVAVLKNLQKQLRRPELSVLRLKMSQ